MNFVYVYVNNTLVKSEGDTQGCALSFLAGCVIGVAFRFVGAAAPIPDTIAGVLGIIGLFAGFKLAGLL